MLQFSKGPRYTVSGKSYVNKAIKLKIDNSSVPEYPVISTENAFKAQTKGRKRNNLATRILYTRSNKNCVGSVQKLSRRAFNNLQPVSWVNN